ncbi:200ca50e-fd55-49ae-b11c-d6c02fd245bd [Sclerotinia trifoliorum]|uniref:200ca50e-fd55-49ae-b11c-d6c02fd245bd n=1 Tax=Sclerotinia trifoliorum TaxID=28548 RepID=A0A8H2ZUW2_9HELO|nr:200ca50e-fd55-49ae-b11c-d6c02fd245bd [Sclerotinia trifoliorum]
MLSPRTIPILLILTTLYLGTRYLYNQPHPHIDIPYNTKTNANANANAKCRNLPSDPSWPNKSQWNQLNATINGRLIQGTPLGQPCYEPQLNSEKCAQIQSEWINLPPYENDPVNIMAPYWQNNSCNPILATNTNNTCILGNLASYALNISNAGDVIAGLEFARENNIRVTIKNTGHDFLGRSTGAGSLALWMHNLDEIAIFNYSGSLYTGPAARIGAGVRYSDLYPVVQEHGFRAVGGSCSTVGIAGGYTQGGGHGPLGSAYGMGADQVLEWEVITASGQHLIVSPMHHADLYWALSGGGAGNFAVVLSVTVRIYNDGPVAGAAFTVVNNDNSTAYWAAVQAWLQTLLVLDTIDGLASVSTITADSFGLNFTALPGVTTTDSIHAVLEPFFIKLGQLNLSLGNSYRADVHANFADFYNSFISQELYTSNLMVGGRIVPRLTVRDKATGLPALIDIFRNITEGGGIIALPATNSAHKNYTPNALLPSWRDALFSVAFMKPLAENAELEDIHRNYAQLNTWQDRLRDITPGAGAYMNEATWDNVHWKADYFGSNYEALLKVKEKYDPEFFFWANAAVGSDIYWKVGENGALCRV